MQPNPTPNLLRAAGSRRVGLAGFTIATLALLTLCGLLTLAFADRLDPLERQRRAAEVYREQQIAGETYDAAVFRARMAELLPPVVAFLVLIGGVAWGGVALYRYATERRPDKRGLVPLLRTERQQAHAALAAYHAARIEEARRPLVPATLHYAPHHELEYRHDGAAQLPGDVAAPSAPSVPSFAQLLDQGRIGKGNPLCLGYDAEGKPVEGSWLQLYSTAVGGLSGSGKSWTATFLAAQAALFGSRIVLCDPHAADEQSLARRLSPMRGRFVCEVASEPGDILRAVALVADELERRKHGGRGEPWLFIADEFSAMQRGELAEPLSALVEALGQEGRKLGLYGMVCGQVWSAARAGGTELRDSLASAYVHRLRPAQARMLTGMTANDLPGDLLQLPAGTAYLLDTSGDIRRVTIPQMTPADVERVAGLLTDSAPTMPAMPGLRLVHSRANTQAEGQAAAGDLDTPRPGDRPGPGPALAWGGDGRASAPGSPTPRSAEEARILALLAAGRSVRSVAAELSGTDNPGERRHKAAREQVEALIAQVAGRAISGG